MRSNKMPPIINYENKTVVVTGAATGVGAALVDRLRAAHAEQIIALDIKPCNGPIDQFIPADLSDPVAIDDAIHPLPESIDVLFNNAGVAATLPLRVVIGVNVLAPRRLIARLHQRMPGLVHDRIPAQPLELVIHHLGAFHFADERRARFPHQDLAAVNQQQHVATDEEKTAECAKAAEKIFSPRSLRSPRYNNTVTISGSRRNPGSAIRDDGTG